MNLFPFRPVSASFVALAAALMAGTAGEIARGQSTPPVRGSADADTIKSRDQELEAVRAEQRRALETTRKLEQEIDALGEDRRKLNQALIDAATRVRAVEEQIAAVQERL